MTLCIRWKAVARFSSAISSKSGWSNTARIAILSSSVYSRLGDLPSTRVCSIAARSMPQILGGCSLISYPFVRSEEHTSELQSLMRISYAVFCLKKKTQSSKYDHNDEYAALPLKPR